jgi:hypothetical protein
MNETRQSLLLRAQTGEQDAWKDLTNLYRPLILGWLEHQGLPARDLDDLSQAVGRSRRVAALTSGSPKSRRPLWGRVRERAWGAAEIVLADLISSAENCGEVAPTFFARIPSPILSESGGCCRASRSAACARLTLPAASIKRIGG